MIQQKLKKKHKRSSWKFLWLYCLLFTAVNVGLVETSFDRMLIKDGDPLWCYFKGTSEPPVDTQGLDWQSVDYNYPCKDGNKYPEASWKLGRSGFGYDTWGNRTYSTTLKDMKGKYSSVYIRHEFDVLDPNNLNKLIISIKYDDGFVAYINGVEVARRNMSSSYTYPPYNDLALKIIDPTLEEISINKDDFTEFNLTAGKNVLAIQGHNRSLDRSSDFALVVNLEAETNKQLPVLPGDTWRYLKGNAVNNGIMPSDWEKADFDDSTWAEGCSGFGYGDSDDCTVLSDMEDNYSSVYIRKEFEIPDESSLKNMQYLTLSVNYDDGFVAYLNGIEVTRRNMSNASDLFDANIVADGDHEAVIKEVFDLTEYIGNLNVGKNVLAIQGHNKSKGSSDFSLIPALTDQPVILVGAGDIAGPSSGGAKTTRDILNDTVFKQADVFNSGIVFTLGDNAYDIGTYNQFTTYYEPNWGGKYKEITRPSVGNHEYFCADYKSNYNCITNAEGYFKYFNNSRTYGRAGDNGKGYYSYDHGTWHIIVLNTCLKALKEGLGGCREENVGIDQEQMNWLKSDLDNNKNKDTLVYFHHPRYTNSKRSGSIAGLENLWIELYNAGVDVVLNGHDHNYQRFAPKRPDGEMDTGTRDDVYGIQQFIVGSGGNGLYELKSSTDGGYVPDMEASNYEYYGVLRLTLTQGRYDWEFITKDGIKDSGSSASHDPPVIKIAR